MVCPIQAAQEKKQDTVWKKSSSYASEDLNCTATRSRRETLMRKVQEEEEMAGLVETNNESFSLLGEDQDCYRTEVASEEQADARTDLEKAMEMKDWATVGVAAAKLLKARQSYFNGSNSMSLLAVFEVETLSSGDGGGDDLEDMVERGDWDGVVQAAAKLEAADRDLFPTMVDEGDPVDLLFLESMYTMGEAMLRRHENEKALECFTIILRMLTSGDDGRIDYEMLEKVLDGMASVHARKNQVDAVINCFEKKMSLMRKRLGAEHVKIATVLHTLGKVLVRLGALDRAMGYFERALNMKKELFGSDHSEVALTLNCMGASLCKLKLHDNALEACTEALRISRVEPQDHEQATMALNIFGLIYKNLSKYEESVKYYEEALRVQKINAGSDVRAIGVTLRNLGDTYFLAENLDKAIVCYKKALSIKEGAKGKEAELLGLLGKLHKEKGALCLSIPEKKETLLKSVRFFEEAYSVQRNGRNQTFVFSTLSTLGEVHAMLGSLDKSLDSYKSALKALKSAEGGFEKNPDAVMATLSQMGSLYMELDDPDGALICFREALKLRRENVSIDEDPHIHRFLQNRGEAHVMKKNYEDALKDYEEALTLVPKNNQQDRLDIQRRISVVLHRKGNFEGTVEYEVENLRLGNLYEEQRQMSDGIRN